MSLPGRFNTLHPSLRDLSLAVCDDSAEGLHPIDIRHAVLETDGNCFVSIGHGTAAEGDEEVGAQATTASRGEWAGM
jgi:hypothetical protein